ncbi:hypothetical protein LOK74_03775 [Brevibacillus humidisoli]|uniref:hypothetical protein n=1 Tax=Brevibacillus humidisoli TaxID=2895522 RepID=UPI001E456369|nr:hypothetical protein [Brevibacillus humidisoli]UFJ41643.1 hypothetical protein LOK74_03775 [Brevibacillus humidisoli]
MMDSKPSIDLAQRFAHLREIVVMYRSRLTQLEAEVLTLFEVNELEAIASSIRERERIERRVEKLEEFVSRWEEQDDLRID